MVSPPRKHRIMVDRDGTEGDIVLPRTYRALGHSHCGIRSRYVLPLQADFGTDISQQLNAAKKDIFNLQLENHFLKERLTKMAPDHIEAALKENVKLKLEILNLSKEMTKLKKLLLQQDRDLAETQRDREGARGGKDAREIEAIYREEKERRKAAEAERKRLQMELDNLRNGEREAPDVEELRAQLEETEAAEAVWRREAEQLEEELETARATAEDQAEEMNQVRNAADQAQEDVERLQSEAEAKLGLSDSIGISKGREARLLAKLEQVSGLQGRFQC